MSFVHLHVHTEGSLLDGMAKTKDLAKRAAELDMPALAVTDHGTMYSTVSHFEACKAEGIKPIVGCEVYVAPGSRFDRDPSLRRYHHMLLLAESEVGYKNLVKLVSRGYLEGYYYKPRVDAELISEFREGLIATSSCLGGDLCSALLANEMNDARRLAAQWREVFGPDRFYVELQDHGLPEQDFVRPGLAQIASELSLSLVCSNDVHYLKQEDADPHEVLLCIQTGRTMRDPGRLRYGPPNFYLRSESDMRARFGVYPEALENTVHIASRCAFEFEFGKHHLPHFDVPAGYTADTYLEMLCRAEIGSRYAAHTERIEERLKYELGIIGSKGFSSYFLIVHDFVRFARSRGIMSQARGSAAGSIVSYLLGLTVIDPLRYNLMFERFLNPDRKSMPDIDLDFADERRAEVIDYCKQKYGADHVAQIVTFTTMAARAAVKDAGRALDMPLPAVERVAQMIPLKPVGIKLAEALEKVPDLKTAYTEQDSTRRLIDTAQRVEGLYRNAGVHAAGVVITAEPVIEYAPLQLMKDGAVAIQYDMEDAEKIGLVKMDFLGLRNLTVVDRCLKLIRQQRGVTLNLMEIPHNDEPTFKLLQRGETIGVFQFESSGMQRLLRNLRPDRLEDLIALVALYRPGPLQSGMATSYVERKHEREAVEYLHPLLEPILRNTYGVILYQEQIMRITMALAGFGPGAAEAAMKGMGKKKKEVIEALEVSFLAGCEENEVDLSIAKQLYEVMVNFAAYGFNMSHSGAYAMLAYHTAYLKAHYPYEFMCANLSSIAGKKDKLAVYVNDIRKGGMTLYPPDVNASQEEFTIRSGPNEPQSIQMGLTAIKGFREGTLASLLEERIAGPFTSFRDFLLRMFAPAAPGDGRTVGRLCTKSDVASLIRVGAFDSFGEGRERLLVAYDRAVDEVKKHGKVQIETQPVPAISKPERLAMERALLGVYVSGHPLADVAGRLRAAVTVQAADLADQRDGDEVTVGGVVVEVVERTTKKGEAMASVTLEDLTGQMTLTLFPRPYATFRGIIGTDRVVVGRGRINSRDGGGEDDAPQVEIRAEHVRLLDEVTEQHTATIHIAAPDHETATVAEWIVCEQAGPISVQVHVNGAEPYSLARTVLSPQHIKDSLVRLKRKGCSLWIE